jgi:MoaA/NifB/PqqE/SkfB family radical SAM enzyme
MNDLTFAAPNVEKISAIPRFLSLCSALRSCFRKKNPASADHRFTRDLIGTAFQSIRLWAGVNPARIASIAGQALRFRRSARKRAATAEHDNIKVPPVIILSATMKCNLACKGCYSRNYALDNELTIRRMDRLFDEAEELGVSVFVITGGEPFLRDGLLDLLIRHRKLVFMLFNNGTLIDADAAKRIGRSHNIIPFVSIEGDEAMTDARRGKGVYRKALDAMALLRKERAYFGFSTMVTTENIELVKRDSYYDDFIARGCRMGLLVGYVPVCADSPLDLLPSSESQRALHARVNELQRLKRLILVQMPDDEYEVAGSCLAASKGFVHINAQGYVEPCPFFHRSTHTVRDCSLREALDSPWLRHIREKTNFTEIPHKGCALFEHGAELAQAAEAMGVLDTEKAS